MGTVIVGIIVLAIAGGAAYSLHRDKKNGKSQCGGDTAIRNFAENRSRNEV